MNVLALRARMELSVQMVPISTHVNVLKVTQDSTVRLTSMSATLTPATMAPVRMVWPLSHVTAALATPAGYVRPTSMSV